MMKEFRYEDAVEYYDKDYWDTLGVKSGYTNMTGTVGGEWHKQACGWFDSVIPVKGKTLLDAGCGLGHFMVGFADLGADVTGCDVSDFCCDFIRKNLKLPVFQTALEDMHMISRNAYDIIFCTSTLEHIPQQHIEATLKNLCRVARPGGIIYLEADTLPNSHRDMPEDSHVNVRPWNEWYAEITRPIYGWFPLLKEETALGKCTQFPGFPLPEWHFTVLWKI